MKVSDLTYKVLAYQEIAPFNADQFIDWAFEMVEMGYHSPSLIILAGKSYNSSPFELSTYFTSALDELGISAMTGPTAVQSAVAYHLLKIVKSDSVRENLAMVHQMTGPEITDTDISRFHYLHWAWGDLDFSNDEQDYWPGATRENIESIVIEEAKKWLNVHKPKLRLTGASRNAG